MNDRWLRRRLVSWALELLLAIDIVTLRRANNRQGLLPCTLVLSPATCLRRESDTDMNIGLVSPLKSVLHVSRTL